MILLEEDKRSLEDLDAAALNENVNWRNFQEKISAAYTGGCRFLAVKYL